MRAVLPFGVQEIAVCFRVFQNDFEGKDAVEVAGGFAVQVQIPKIVRLLVVQHILRSRQSFVVGGRYQRPAFQPYLCPFEVAGGGFGG